MQTAVLDEAAKSHPDSWWWLRLVGMRLSRVPFKVTMMLDRNRHGGGILVLVRDNLTVVRRSDLESDCELLWLELFSGIGPALFGTFYRSSSSDVSAVNSLTYHYFPLSQNTQLFYVEISIYLVSTGQLSLLLFHLPMLLYYAP